MYFLVRNVHKITKSYYELDHVCLSVRTEQLGSHWTDFDKMWLLSIFRKSVQKLLVQLKFGKNNRYFEWRPKYIYNTMMNVS